MPLGRIRTYFTAAPRLMLKEDFSMTNFIYFKQQHYRNHSPQATAEYFPQALSNEDVFIWMKMNHFLPLLLFHYANLRVVAFE